MAKTAKKTTELAVNAIGDREELTVSYPCWCVEVRQKVSDATKLLYRTSDVITGGVAEEHYAGTAAFYYPSRSGPGEFGVGETLGFIETDSSSATFQLIHYLGKRWG